MEEILNKAIESNSNRSCQFEVCLKLGCASCPEEVIVKVTLDQEYRNEQDYQGDEEIPLDTT
jgi:hypothetical protein